MITPLRRYGGYFCSSLDRLFYCNLSMFVQRVLSGMRPTGALHLGHYHGVLKNWIKLQNEYPCWFFVADWHALTTHYETVQEIAANTHEMVIDWLAAGVDPSKATLFVQSRVPQHAELHLLLSMITPLSWLERVPSYREQQEKISGRDLTTYGFLGYPLLQAADILIYRAQHVPVGQDQAPHVEFTREIARRVNSLYGRTPDSVKQIEEALGRLGSKAKHYQDLRVRYQQAGDAKALAEGRTLLGTISNFRAGDHELLQGYLEGTGRMILQEPRALLTDAPRMTGLDGEKMSKSYGNTIGLREDKGQIEKKIKSMPTDPARQRRTDPGDPLRCPVWWLHEVYSDEPTCSWVMESCRTASIGCLDCKKPLIESVLKEQQPILERAQPYLDKPGLVEDILEAGCSRARVTAEETLQEVRRAMGLGGLAG